ncbi:hypothetical protein [Fodinicola feengrottensis]|uniref:hypothetical protein n=1 Tax=Fodinicola feengrottensis TaxID=435914 RepID=UPI002441367B|nr:hypothetical protein [Fodinicola feengrottensis]
MLPLSVVIAVCIAAVVHACWNAIAHAITDRWAAIALVAVGGAGCGVILIAVAPLPARASWLPLGISAAIHVAYMMLLILSYRLADFGQAYPLARGTSPLLVAVGATVLVGEHLSPPQVCGVAVVSAGLVSVALLGGKGGRPHLPAIGAAVATGVACPSRLTPLWTASACGCPEAHPATPAG